MSPVQNNVLKFIEDYWELHNHSPTYKEIAAGCKMKYASQAYRTVIILWQERWVSLSQKHRRSVRSRRKYMEGKTIVLPEQIVPHEIKQPDIKDL